MSFNTIIDWNSCTAEQQRQLLMRPAISASESITRTVNDILDNVKARGDEALREYSAKFDKTTVTALKVSAEEIAAASGRLVGHALDLFLGRGKLRLHLLRLAHHLLHIHAYRSFGCADGAAAACVSRLPV